MAKRILAILVVCVLAVSAANPLIAVDTTSAATVARTTLMELFTATWCGYCAAYGPNADRAYDELGPQQVILLRDQVGQDGLDTDETNARASFYGVTGVPTLYLNGTYAYIADYSGFVQRIRDMNSVAALFQVSVSAQVQGATSQGTAAIEVRSLTSSGYGNLHLIVALFEKVVTYQGTNGVKTHRFVVRDYLFGETGEQVGLAGFQTRQFSYPLTLPNGSNPADFGIAAWIQDFSTKEILQAESADITVAGQGQCTITASSPSGGESWVPGSVQSVTWTVTGDTSAIHHFSLYYTVDGGNSWESIGFAPSAARSSSWTVPARFSSHAKVIVYAMNAASEMQAYDASNADFTIAPAGAGTLPAVTLVHPSGDTWTAGTTQMIYWNMTGVFPAAFHHYAVYASLEDGRNGSWFNVGYSPTPSLSWAIPGAIGSAHAKIVVYAMDASSNLLSDATFAIFAITPVSGIAYSITTPSVGATPLHVSGTAVVTWTEMGTRPSQVSSCKVYYSVDGGLSWEVAVGTTTAVSPFFWLVPARLSSACKVMVVAIDATGNALGVATSSAFTIAP